MRGIRRSIRDKEFIIPQFKAIKILLDEGYDNIAIFPPMTNSIKEYKSWLQIAKNLGIKKIKKGLMVETPRAALMIEEFFKEISFVVFGTNDLTSFLLSVDRNNPRVANLFSVFHPPVLQVLNDIAINADRVKLRHSVCGEMAGDPGAAILLMAMGYEALSMNINALGRVKSVIRNVTIKQTKSLLEKALQAEDSEKVKSLIDMELYNAGVERLLRSARS